MAKHKTIGDFLNPKKPTKKQELASLRKAIKEQLRRSGIEFNSRTRTVVDNGSLDAALRKTLQSAGFKIQYSLFNTDKNGND